MAVKGFKHNMIKPIQQMHNHKFLTSIRPTRLTIRYHSTNKLHVELLDVKYNFLFQAQAYNNAVLQETRQSIQFQNLKTIFLVFSLIWCNAQYFKSTL